MSIPGSNNGLPIGLQILSAPFEEEKMLRVVSMYEKATIGTRRPSLRFAYEKHR
jgi:aspartyl-tRNA(Asn)/glutamyl-tRNA(Gln) amidotransferase subunit A